MLGIIVRGDLGSGLQSQTYNLTRMLKPQRLLYVDSTQFNKAKQYPQLYEGFNMQQTRAWPTNLESARFVRGLTHILTAETIYNNKIYELAKYQGVKVFTQLNWEFLDHIQNRRMPKPYKWLMPSYWHLDDMVNLFPNTMYLPPPIIMSDFKEARDKNLKRNGKRRFLHIMGKVAVNDRNGTFDLIDSLKYAREDFELVIRSQYPVDEYMKLANDNRIRFDIQNINNQNDMYSDFDMMVLPRRYGGLCLPMNEALASALPVVMTNIEPNDHILPQDWLCGANRTHDFMARTRIDIFSSDIISLGKKLDYFAAMDKDDLTNYKTEALDIAMENYSSDALKPKYMEVMGL